jgi:hypothetical protein
MGEAGAHIEGVTFVVDAMYGTQPVMDPFTGLEVSEMVPISQAVRPRMGLWAPISHVLNLRTQLTKVFAP